MPETEYLKQLPNGKWMDTRYKYGRGTRVRLIDGPNRGRLATVDSCVFLQGTEDVPGYHLELAEEEWVTVRWDWVERLRGNRGPPSQKWEGVTPTKRAQSQRG